MEELAKMIDQAQLGRDLDQVVFREGGLMYHQLQQIDRANNPNLYNDVTDTAIVGPLTRFQEDKQHQEGEEEEEELPLLHCLHTQELMQAEDSSSATQTLPKSSEISTRPSEPIKPPTVPFPQEEDWTLWLNDQLDREFQ